ncbi:MAG: bidirectional hydrogenase complex protein HoxU [Candidatus Omnitrophica bacterium CG07_land_8_20_14_0_80_50_8]|nr:MAG: bidirectional hydrogenase complex protein HoxU [Candidatus Omnitrophica bacterium CG1_02_49_16]PIU39789.1 MAG: bidirectional hydrogenase complex protein HoxU [Candidatus Omnitrophica bacterium CG07_land_8_20_14_0_80_50_8]
MNASFTITIDNQSVEATPGESLLEVCRKANIPLPVMCDFKGLSPVGACRLCLVEIEGVPKLLPACTTLVAPNQAVHTQSDKLRKYRRMIIELIFSERNHICAICVANNNCELQKMAYELGMDHVRFPYLTPVCEVDASHEKYVMDHNRCILCTRCVRVCSEIEGAMTRDVMGRGFDARIITEFKQPWGDSTGCTSCGKCVQVCPTGALTPNDAAQGRLKKNPELVALLIEKREAKP